jgi:hypothetical protein
MPSSKAARYPEKLYKFCAFSPRSLDLLNRERIYYSDPTTFNDPLDCNPVINDDLPTRDLVQLCLVWTKAEHADVPIGSPLVHDEGREVDGTADAFYRRDLTNDLTRLLRDELGASGVLSLTARWDSPLMWSHYADQHRGVCIEYDTTWGNHTNLRRVNYNTPRSISAADLLDWKVHGSAEAEARVREAYFFAKALDWSYEEEWRYIHEKHGVDHATLKVTGVYFGLRCLPIVRSIFMSVLPRETTFREVYAKRESFDLDSRWLDRSEEISMAQATSAYLDFADQINAAKRNID